MIELPQMTLSECHALTTHRLDRIESAMTMLHEAVAELIGSQKIMAEAMAETKALRRDEERHHEANLRIHQRLDDIEKMLSVHQAYFIMIGFVLGSAVTSGIAYITGVI
jgi:tetrahydromethanopterin S-methyltransferase subunit G